MQNKILSHQYFSYPERHSPTFDTHTIDSYQVSIPRNREREPLSTSFELASSLFSLLLTHLELALIPAKAHIHIYPSLPHFCQEPLALLPPYHGDTSADSRGQHQTTKHYCSAIMVQIDRNAYGVGGLHLATDCFTEEVERRIFLALPHKKWA